MNWGILAVVVILLIYFAKPYYVTASVAAVTPTALSTVDQIKMIVPDPPVGAVETTVVVKAPLAGNVTPLALPAESQIELYTDKNYKGDVRTIRVGQGTDFAEMNGGALTWKYQSMKIVPGTLLMLSSSVSGSNDRGFLVGKYDVPDLFEVIKSYDNVYAEQGIFMDRTYWARPFKIKVLNPASWETELTGKYSACKQTTEAWATQSPSWAWDNKGKAHCEYALPDNNRANYT